MKKYLLYFLTATSLVAAPVSFIIPTRSGYDCLPGQAAFSQGALASSPITNLYGYFYEVATAGITVWHVPISGIFTTNNLTNMVMSCNILTTNGMDSDPHTYAMTFRFVLYTNTTALASLTPPSPTNTFNVYYDSGDKTALGVCRVGTNITFISMTNTISTNLFANMTNIAYGTLGIKHQVVGGTTGSKWILNAKIDLKR